MSEDEARMTFIEHLSELRTRVIRSCAAILVSIFVCCLFYNHIFAWTIKPLGPLQRQGVLTVTPDGPAPEAPAPHADATPSRPIGMTALNPFEPFVVQFKLSAYAGIVVALPYVIFQLCLFVFPGLKPGERAAAKFLLIGSATLVLAGVCVAYFLVFPLVLPYIVQYAPAGVSINLRMSETVGIILKGLLGFAAAFQFPMVVLVLVHAGLLTPAVLRRYRRVVIVGLFALAAVITPPDALSMLLMGAPLVLLYELSIWASYLVLRRRQASARKEG
ncbi:MAG TPA: twin-arginine translocase subunit TatC [Candidatus Hydrogenedentes bacterium]|nr:twin-arginine translocase subunit TatC [Candidatus Hydrogenedentota bacterium]HOS02473.1 twin-arginine translocase subunit TatC [Candidatus Hydrogenedentota bacterium]